MLVGLQYNKQSFEQPIKGSFAFAVLEFGMHFGNVRASGGSNPRDAALVARWQFLSTMTILTSHAKSAMSILNRFSNI